MDLIPGRSIASIFAPHQYLKVQPALSESEALSNQPRLPCIAIPQVVYISGRPFWARPIEGSESKGTIRVNRFARKLLHTKSGQSLSVMVQCPPVTDFHKIPQCEEVEIRVECSPGKIPEHSEGSLTALVRRSLESLVLSAGNVYCARDERGTYEITVVHTSSDCVSRIGLHSHLILNPNFPLSHELGLTVQPEVPGALDSQSIKKALFARTVLVQTKTATHFLTIN